MKPKDLPKFSLLESLVYTGWLVIFLKKVKYNSRTIQGFFKYIFGPEYSHTPQNMRDKHN